MPNRETETGETKSVGGDEAGVNIFSNLVHEFFWYPPWVKQLDEMEHDYLCIFSCIHSSHFSLTKCFYLAIASSIVIPLLRFFLNKKSAFHIKAIINKGHFLYFFTSFSEMM